MPVYRYESECDVRQTPRDRKQKRDALYLLVRNYIPFIYFPESFSQLYLLSRRYLNKTVR